MTKVGSSPPFGICFTANSGMTSGVVPNTYFPTIYFAETSKLKRLLSLCEILLVLVQFEMTMVGKVYFPPYNKAYSLDTGLIYQNIWYSL